MLHKLMMGTLPLIPRALMRRIAGKYIAGETQAEALAKLQELSAQGFSGVYDILGEGSSTEAHARSVARDYCAGASAIAAAGLDSYVSIKPTHLGLTTDESLALELYREIARHCAEIGVFLRVEMEDHPTTEATLRIYDALRTEFTAVGIVLQARLFRTPADIEALTSGPIDIRLVKGIYLEPAEIAHTNHAAIRAAYVAQARQLLERGDVQLRLATHDDAMARELIDLLREFDVPKERYEFQVLLGVQQALWKRWRDEGHPVRVYVPFGPDWREYSLRRLRHNPELFRAVARDLLPI